ncbi:MAG: hypothetical protein HY204_00710 [Nitrospirae bacterium]|nr:hypothetical protein [Nitrospirota bacterium]
MGPQKGLEPNKPTVGANDSQIKESIDAAVLAAEKLGFQYDASKSKDGIVMVTALWKSSPVTLIMEFHSEIVSIHLASLTSQTGLANLENGGQKIEKLYYSALREKTDKRGLKIYPDSEEESFVRLRSLTLPPEKASKEKARKKAPGSMRW